MADERKITLSGALPGEAIAVRILDFIDKRRTEMSPELRERHDKMALEIVEWWHARFKRLGDLLDGN